MINFEFNAPTRIIFGENTHLKIAEIINEYGFKKVLLHFGQNSVVKSGLYDVICGLLHCQPGDIVEHIDGEPDSDMAGAE